MAFGNEDAIDRRNRERIRELQVRNHQLESGLRSLTNAFRRSTSMTQNEKAEAILAAQKLLAHEGGSPDDQT